jgi:hypothetical protein
MPPGKEAQVHPDPVSYTGQAIGVVVDLKSSCFSILARWPSLRTTGPKNTGFKDSAGDGVKANLRDRTLGFGVQYRIARVGRHSSIGAFGKAAYYGSHIHATYFDSNQTVNVEYRASARDPLVTIGPEIGSVANSVERPRVKPARPVIKRPCRGSAG